MALPEFLTASPDGEIRLTGHRIGLSHVLYHYDQGYSPEMLVCQYPSLSLAHVHKVIAWYLDNQAEADAYLAHCQAELSRQLPNFKRLDASSLRQRLEALRRPSGPQAESA